MHQVPEQPKEWRANTLAFQKSENLDKDFLDTFSSVRFINLTPRIISAIVALHSNPTISSRENIMNLEMFKRAIIQKIPEGTILKNPLKGVTEIVS